MNQPGPGATVNWGHPISQGLTAAWLFNGTGLGTLQSLVSPRDQLVQQGTTSFSPGASGYGLRATGSNDSSGLKQVGKTGSLEPPKTVSLLWRGMVLGTASVGGNNPYLASYSYKVDDGTSPYYAYAIVRYAGVSQDRMFFGWNDGSTNRYRDFNRSLSSRYMQPMQFVFCLDANNSISNCYDGGILLNGSESSSSVGYGTIAYTATSGMQIGHGATTAVTQCHTSHVAVWNRCLQPSEVRALASEPYAMYVPAPGRRFNVFPGPEQTLRQAINRGAVI